MPSSLLMTGAAALRCEDVRLHFAHFCVLQLVQRTLASYNRCEDVRLQNAKAYFCFLQLFQRTIVHRAIVHRKILQLCTGQNKAIWYVMWCDVMMFLMSDAGRRTLKATFYNILQCFAMFHIVLQCFAMFYNVLQCFRMVTFNVISWAAAWGGQRTFGSKICDLRHFGSFGKQDNQCIHILVSALAHLTMYYRVVF